jgi:hypothetical protein
LKYSVKDQKGIPSELKVTIENGQILISNFTNPLTTNISREFFSTALLANLQKSQLQLGVDEKIKKVRMGLPIKEAEKVEVHYATWYARSKNIYLRFPKNISKQDLDKITTSLLETLRTKAQ